MGKVSLEAIVEAVNDLPALPGVVVRVMELTEDANATIYDINQVLNQDQAMTAKVLKMANSAFYGFPRRISTVTDATIFLGFKTIRSIVLAASISDMLSQELEGYALAPGELWRHSQCTAMASREIAKKTGGITPDLAYTAALLHDIGKLVLNRDMKEAYQDIVKMADADKVSFIEAEDRILGFNHAVVGARIAEKWSLPAELVEAIEKHHNPDKAEINPKLIATVHLADVLCVSMGIGMGIDGLLNPVSEYAMQTINFTENDLEEIVSTLADVFTDQQSF